MEATGALPFSAWESFYVIVGSSAAALTGLQFVVIVLGAEMNMLASGDVKRAFATPTVVHFCAALLISAILTAPWHAVFGAAAALAVCGIAGMAYVGIVISHTRRQTEYRPVLEDWVWHCAFPSIAYAALLIAALFLNRYVVLSLFAVGSASILLLFTGIHNAWDAVTWMALNARSKPDDPTPER